MDRLGKFSHALLLTATALSAACGEVVTDSNEIGVLVDYEDGLLLAPGEMLSLDVQVTNPFKEPVWVSVSDPKCGCAGRASEGFLEIKPRDQRLVQVQVVGVPGRMGMFLDVYWKKGQRPPVNGTLLRKELEIDCPPLAVGAFERIDHPDDTIQFSESGVVGVEIESGRHPSPVVTNLSSNAYSVEVLGPEEGTLDVILAPIRRNENQGQSGEVPLPPFVASRSGVGIAGWAGWDRTRFETLHHAPSEDAGFRWELRLEGDIGNGFRPELDWVANARGLRFQVVRDTTEARWCVQVESVVVPDAPIHVTVRARQGNESARWACYVLES